MTTEGALALMGLTCLVFAGIGAIIEESTRDDRATVASVILVSLAFPLFIAAIWVWRVNAT